MLKNKRRLKRWTAVVIVFEKKEKEVGQEDNEGYICVNFDLSYVTYYLYLTFCP